MPEAGHMRFEIALRLMLSMTLCFALCAIAPFSSPAQDSPSIATSEEMPNGESEFPESGWTAEIPDESAETPGIVIPAVEEAPPPIVAVHSDEEQQVPVLQFRGEYFDPSGLCATGTMSEQSSQAIRSRMRKTAEMGFRCFMLRVDWPSIEPEPNRVDATRVQELLQYADDLGLKVIISLELSRAPAWFFRGEEGSGRLMTSYIVDPEREPAMGNDGPLRWANGTGVPLYYHPDTMRAVSNIVYSLYNTIRSEPALLGWYLSGPVTLAYPGGGRDGVVGICDYSLYSVNRFNEVTGIPLTTFPLPRYSHGSWDKRPEFRTFAGLRLAWKREAFEGLLSAFREVGNEHLVLIGMEPALNYRNDNGYLAMVQAADSTRQMLHADVDGAVIAFRLSSRSFDPTNARSESSAMHLALTINQVARNGRLAVVLIEPDTAAPPSSIDITHIAYMIKAAGAYPIWTSGFIEKHSHRWSWNDEVAIERAQPLSILPPPKRIRRGQVAILDIPCLYSAFYAEQNGSIMLQLSQLALHQRTGVQLEIVGIDEIRLGKPVLEQYRNVVYLARELIEQEAAKSWLGPGAQFDLATFRALGGVIEVQDPLLLNQYMMEDCHSFEIEDRMRTQYVRRGVQADLLNGADMFIIANDPYIYVRINMLHGSRWVDIKLTGWPESSLTEIDFIDVEDGDPVSAEVVSNSASFKFAPTHDSVHFLMLADDYAPVARPYENRRIGVTMTQQSRHMRRSVPAALLLAALLGVTMIWMTFQSQQKSLLQAAQLVDRRRSIEPIDILDEPEVKEFYEKYISGGEEPGLKGNDKTLMGGKSGCGPDSGS